METVEIECRCVNCIYWKKFRYLKHDGICLCQVDEYESKVPKKDNDFCSYAKMKTI